MFRYLPGLSQGDDRNRALPPRCIWTWHKTKWIWSFCSLLFCTGSVNWGWFYSVGHARDPAALIPFLTQAYVSLIALVTPSSSCWASAHACVHVCVCVCLYVKADRRTPQMGFSCARYNWWQMPEEENVSPLSWKTLKDKAPALFWLTVFSLLNASFSLFYTLTFVFAISSFRPPQGYPFVPSMQC